MKAIASVRNKITKVSVSTVLFLIGCLIAVLAAGLQWIIPGNQLVLFLVAVGGVALAVWQKFSGDHERRQQFEQERKTREAAEQYIYDRTPEGKVLRNISQLRAEMHMDSRGPHS